jgi:hypothetical protein
MRTRTITALLQAILRCAQIRRGCCWAEQPGASMLGMVCAVAAIEKDRVAQIRLLRMFHHNKWFVNSMLACRNQIDACPRILFPVSGIACPYWVYARIRARSGVTTTILNTVMTNDCPLLRYKSSEFPATSSTH